jgi:hypothetical protein
LQSKGKIKENIYNLELGRWNNGNGIAHSLAQYGDEVVLCDTNELTLL